MWAKLLDLTSRGGEVALDEGRQAVRFRTGTKGITDISIRGLAATAEVCGVTFHPE